jgi:CDP-4-dehydro-6-deoxyglucose reductase
MSATDTPAPVPAKPKGRHVLKMRVAEIRDYTPRIRELFIESLEPETFEFRCGQFVMLHVPAEPKTLLRAYSMASGDQKKNGFRLIFNYVDEGPASIFVWGLKGGDILDFTGPFGRLFFKEPPTEQIIFLNTGSGVSQHFSYMESMIEKYPNLNYRMLFGVRTEKDTYYQTELERLKKHFKNFEYHFVLSRPTQEWTGKKGYVQDHISEYKYLETPTTFYMCGNGGMIKAVKHRLSEEGFDSAHVLAEAFD